MSKATPGLKAIRSGPSAQHKNDNSYSTGKRGIRDTCPFVFKLIHSVKSVGLLSLLLAGTVAATGHQAGQFYIVCQGSLSLKS